MSRLFVVALTLVLTGCTSIPLSTMLEFRSFGKEKFLTLQPEHIEAKIEFDEPVRADVEQSRLAVKLTTEHDVRSYQFPLVLLSQQHIPAERGLFSQQPAKNQYRFRLSDEAVQNFHAVQEDTQRHDAIAFEFTVNSAMEPLPEHIDEVRLSLFLKLSEDSDFTTMFRNAKLKVNRAE